MNSIITTLVALTAAAAAAAAPRQAISGGLGVQTSSGLLQGSKQSAINGSAVYQFLSVPYAAAPVGKLRFQKPVPLDAGQARHSIVDATQLGKTCPQFRHLTQYISPLMNLDEQHQISEDCLRLHIYVPESQVQQADNANALAPLDEPLPVIVWLPGEGFDFADARQFDGSYLAQATKSIVIVVQYRVGVLGFMNSHELKIKGNMGMHDQLAALAWVRDNVAAFGGEPNNVSLMGRLSGSMSISSLITAPKQELIRDTTGKLLFKRVALISGVTVDDWILDSKQHQRAEQIYSKALEEGLCEQQVTKLECLQSIQVDKLTHLAGHLWRPSRDQELIGDLLPAEAVQHNQLASDLDAVLFGGAKSEGTLCLYRHLLTPSSSFGQLFEDNNKMTPSDLFSMLRDDAHFYFKHPIKKTNPIEATLESMAEGELANGPGASLGLDETSEELSARLRDSYLSACSDFLIKSPAEQLKRQILTLNKHAETRFSLSKKPIKVYHYELVYKPSISLAPDYVKTAAHGDDVMLLFGLAYKQAHASAEDLATSRRLTQLVSNFVHGKPAVGLEVSNQQALESPEPPQPLGSAVSSIGWSNEGKPVEFEYLAPLADNKLASDRTRVILIEQQQLQQQQQVESTKQSATRRPFTRPVSSHDVGQQSRLTINTNGSDSDSETPLESQTTNAVLLLSVAVVALSLTTLCFIALIYVHRPQGCRAHEHHLEQSHHHHHQRQQQHHDHHQQKHSEQHGSQSVASSFNICADADDRVLGQKDGRPLNSVFAKLSRNHQQPQELSEQQVQGGGDTKHC